MPKNPLVERHAPLFDRPLSASMGKAVIAHLSKLTQLPARGCLAGQSVMSALMALYPSESHFGHVAPIKDVDVFHGAQDRYIEDGFFTTLKPTETAEIIQLVKTPVDLGSYHRVFDCKLNIDRVQVSGILNLIELVPGSLLTNAVNATMMIDADRLDTVISEFDLSVVQVGVDLKTGEMRWTPGFEAVSNGNPVQTDDIGFAERTWMRYQKKRAQMPWLTWDDAQIRSTTQLAQIRTYTLLANSDKATKVMNAWRASHSVEHISDLQESDRLLPIWDWKDCNDRPAALKEVVRMRDAGQFDLNPRDRILFDWFVWQFGSSEESNMIDINNNIGGDLILAKDGLRNIIKEAGVQTLRDYLQAGGSLLDGASPDEFRLGRRPILIHDAIKFNNPDIVSLLLDEGFSPNDRNASLGETAYLNLWSRLANFQEGVDRGKGIELLQRMRQMGADVTLPFNLDSTIFHEAVWRVPYEWLALEMPHHAQHMGLTNAWGRLPHESLEEIFSSGNNDLARTISLFNVTPHAMDCMKMTQLLMHGCRCGDMSAVELALEDGACAKRGVVVTPLFAAAHHGHAHIVQKLLDAGADWSVKEAQGRTPLMAAAKQGHVGVMKVLLDAGAAIDDMSLDGNTALVHAALLNEKEAVNFLTMKGAKVDLILSNGVRFIETAANSFVKAEVISTLVKKLGQQLDSFAFEVILNRSKDAAIKKQKSEIVSVLDSALAMLYVDRVLDERRPVSRVAA